MDLSKLKSQFSGVIHKYKFPILVLCIGIVVVLWPVQQSNSKETKIMESVSTTAYISDMKLAAILSKVAGAGRVEVLLSVDCSEQKEYQTDMDSSASAGQRLDTVVTTDSERNENGLIKKVIAPTYRGALVVCDGADDPAVHLSVVAAVSNITGLRSDQISVMKME